MATPLRVLIVDDSDDDAVLLASAIRRDGYAVDHTRVDSAAAMAAALAAGGWDVIISDISMPGFSGAEALALFQAARLDCRFIVVSGVVGEEAAVDMLKAGAHDFVLKGNLTRLVPAIARELREVEVRRARHAAEAALQTSEERYALVANATNDGLWDWDLSSGGVYYSPRWAEQLGLAESEIRPCPEEWLNRIHPEDATLVRRQFAAHLDRAGGHFQATYRARHKSGEWRWMLTRALVVRDDAGAPCRVVGAQTDITEQKRAEEQLSFAMAELKEALAAKNRFLAAASHDLRQPVQALVFFSAVLNQKLRSYPGGEILDDLTAAIEALRGLLDSLLDVSKLDAGVVRPELGWLPIDRLLDRLEKDNVLVAANKGLALRMVRSGVHIHTDPVLFGRLLQNLVSNAIRYTRSGRVLVGCRRRGEVLRLQVIDTGIGIPADRLGDIFQEFTQVANPERDRNQGLGLGLAIVRRIADLLGYRIEVRSRLGRGSAFSVDIPLSVAPAHLADTTERRAVGW